MLHASLNLGIVEGQGKMDIDKVVATWRSCWKRIRTMKGKDKILELMAQAKRHLRVKPGTPATPLP